MPFPSILLRHGCFDAAAFDAELRQRHRQLFACRDFLRFICHIIAAACVYFSMLLTLWLPHTPYYAMRAMAAIIYLYVCYVCAQRARAARAQDMRLQDAMPHFDAFCAMMLRHADASPWFLVTLISSC